MLSRTVLEVKYLGSHLGTSSSVRATLSTSDRTLNNRTKASIEIRDKVCTAAGDLGRPLDTVEILRD